MKKSQVILPVLSVVLMLVLSCKKSETPPEEPPPPDPTVNYLHAQKYSGAWILEEDGTLAFTSGGHWYQYDSLANVIDLAGGYALLADGTVWSTRDSNSMLSPVQMPGFSNIISISAGGYAIFGLKNDGTVWAAGRNNYGQLGNGTYTDTSIAVMIPGLTNVMQISAGFDAHVLALKNDSTVWGWGRNVGGLENNSYGYPVPQPVQLTSYSGIKFICAGNGTTFGVKGNGTVLASGNNGAGTLGDGTQNNSLTSVQVNNLTDVVSVSDGIYFALALKSDSTVWAWGLNMNYYLGDGTTNPSFVPIKVSYLSGIKFIEAGSHAIQNNGVVWAWGDNTAGALGIDLSKTTIPVPERVEYQ